MALGICSEDITLVGRLIGEKLIMTEFIGYISLGELKTAGAFMQEKSITMATYMLCGFANLHPLEFKLEELEHWLLLKENYFQN